MSGIMRKSFATSSVLVFLLWNGLVGCTPADKTTGDMPSAAVADKKPRIGLIMKSLANEFFATMAEGAKTHQSAHADQYELVVSGIKDERDIARQMALVEEMATGGVQAIVIAPADSKALIPALRRAVKAGVVVINIDNKLDPQLLEKENLAIPFVGPNNRTGAEKVGDYLASKLSAGDAVAILEGLRTSENGRQRKEGFEAAMGKAKLTIVDSQSAEWEMSQANTIATSMLSEHPEIKGILAANDSMALGVVAAAKAMSREDLLIVGFDNITAVQAAIGDGKVLATADQHADQLAVFGIEAALQRIASPEAPVSDVETPVDLVTAQSLRE